MDVRLSFFLDGFYKHCPGISDDLVKEVQDKVAFEFPPDYIEVMKEFNGGEGGMGENRWLMLFPFDELIKTNQDYAFLMQDIPDYFLFGKDAADEGFAFHKTNKTLHAFGLMSDFNTDPIIFCGNNFLEFLEYLYNY